MKRPVTIRPFAQAAGLSLFALALLAVSGALAPRLHAQATQGAILGSVTDASGASISGAQITVRNEGTNTERTMPTNEAGDYRQGRRSR
jgi:hypothetical protein